MGAFTSVEDWDDAYANRDHIDDAQKFIDSWEILAPKFRQDWAEGAGSLQLDVPYGTSQREKFDVFYPAGSAKGLFVFVHGGYWVAFDKSNWSHLARGALDRGWAVALPSYTLCPNARISEITSQVGAAIETAAGLIDGPIVLAGHSAGGHLVSRMGCANAPLGAAVSARIRRIVSISGLHDLRPFLQLELNSSLMLDEAEAAAESPALLLPTEGIEIDCVVGGIERPEFIRQNVLLANIWVGLGARTREIIVEGKHHFNIIEELHDHQHGWLHNALNEK